MRNSCAWLGSVLLPFLLGGCGIEETSPSIIYSAGHADLAFELNANGSGFDVYLLAEGATIDSQERVRDWYALEDVRVVSDASMQRPASDGGAFASLCIDSGQSVHWLPQRLEDASRLDAPFLGIGAYVDRGVLVDDQVTLSLLEVRSPSENGHYALWRDGFPPTFFMTTCNGIDASDVLNLPLGHDHFNMAFTEAGEWSVRYRVTAEHAADKRLLSSDVTVSYVLQ